MEELQDAIEDAQYVNAISTKDDGPRPVSPWEIPTEEQLASWKQKKLKGDEDAFGIDWTLSTAIGLFIFSAFLKEDCDDYIRINFCEEVVRWRKLKGRARIEKARKILSAYVKPIRRDEDGRVIPPRKTEIDDYELERPIPDVLEEDLINLCDENLDMTRSKCLVGLDGPVREALFTKLQVAEEARGFVSKRSSGGTEVSDIVEKEMTIDENHAVSASDFEEVSRELLEGAPSEKKQSVTESLPTSSEHKDNGGSLDEVVPPPPDFDRFSSAFRLPGRTQSFSSRNLADNYFEEAEVIVMESLRRDYWQAFLRSEKHRRLLNFLWFQDRPVVPDDFFVMRVLGRGGFGLVTACKKGTSGKLYAMKVMNKRRIKMKKSEQLAMNERLVLAAVESPFVVNLKYSFHSKDDMFLILDLMTGGDLGYHLHQKGRFPKKESQYYAARIMLGLQALHDKGYVYRDLKPENCLLADDGRVKITDLGLATKVTPTLHGAAGTRGYWAPEMLRRDRRGRRMPYGHTVDWFSFGCCLAEFISGQNPFRSEAALNFGMERGKQTKEKAIDCATMEMDPEFDPSKFDEDAADICRKLLDKDENRRIGVNGCQAIMAHHYFKEITWEMIISDRKKPPFIPAKDVNAASQSEIGNFAEDRAYQETVIERKDEEFYRHWAWTNPRAFAAEVIEFLIYERETGEPLLPQQQHATCCCVIS